MTATVPGWLHFVRAPTRCEWCGGSGQLNAWPGPYTTTCKPCAGTGQQPTLRGPR